MDWDHARFFLAIHREGSLSAAARALRVDQTTVGRRLAALEEELATKLFRRTQTGWTITPAGERILPSVQAAEDALLSLERQVSGDDARLEGNVRVTASESIATRLIIPGLADLAERHPAIEVEVVVSTRMLNLSRREADVAVRMVRPDQPNLVARRAGEVAFALYASERYLAKRGKPKVPDLSGHDVLRYGEEIASLPEARWIAKHGAKARESFSSNTTFTMTAACAAGFGLAALPCMLGDAEASLVRLTPPLGGREMWLVTHRDLQKNARVRIVLDHLSAVIRRSERLLAGR